MTFIDRTILGQEWHLYANLAPYRATLAAYSGACVIAFQVTIRVTVFYIYKLQVGLHLVLTETFFSYRLSIFSVNFYS